MTVCRLVISWWHRQCTRGSGWRGISNPTCASSVADFYSQRMLVLRKDDFRRRNPRFIATRVVGRWQLIKSRRKHCSLVCFCIICHSQRTADECRAPKPDNFPSQDAEQGSCEYFNPIRRGGRPVYRSKCKATTWASIRAGCARHFLLFCPPLTWQFCGTSCVSDYERDGQHVRDSDFLGHDVV